MDKNIAKKIEPLQVHVAPCACCGSDAEVCGTHLRTDRQIECSGIDCAMVGPRVWPEGEFEDLDEDEINKPKHNGYQPSYIEAARLWNELQRWINRGKLEEMRDPYQDIPHAASKKSTKRRL